MTEIDKEYLEETETIDYSDPVIQGKVDELKNISASELSYIENAYRLQILLERNTDSDNNGTVISDKRYAIMH